nr:primosomal protein N' [Chloroflexota bacterium]
ELSGQQAEPEGELQFRLMQLLEQRGPLRGRQLDRALPRRNWKAAANTLVKRGALTRRPVLQPPSVQPKHVRTARLLVAPARLPFAKLQLRHSPRHADILDHLLGLWPAEPSLVDVLQRTRAAEADLDPLVERGWIKLSPPEATVAPVYPAAVMQQWVAKHGGQYPEAAVVLNALSTAPGPVPVAGLPGASPDIIDFLDGHDMLRRATNPARIVLTLHGSKLNQHAQALRRPSKRAAVLDYLATQGRRVPVSWIYAETGATLAMLKDLAERGLIDLGEEEIVRDPLAGDIFITTEPPTLTPDQQAAWEAVDACFALAAAHAPVAQPPILLHGVTGSGKTELYLLAVARALEQHRQAIVLVPEIALTPQTVQRFAGRFPDRVGVIHSALTEGQRYDTWRRARSGALDVIVGPRSALFAPLPNIGLIVVDEEHDEAYQQDPPLAPYYNARDAAVEYARRLQAICLLGSATPDLVSYAKAQRGDYRLLELPRRIMAHGEYIAHFVETLHATSRPAYRPVSPDNPIAQYADLPDVSVVDMRNELRAGNRSMFSRALQAALADVLARDQQAILFLNRRGTATYIFCRDCGQALACPNCGTPLTYHHTGDTRTGVQLNAPTLRCHHCGHSRRQPKTCPNCKSERIKYFGAGTEKVESELKALFPEALPLRWDWDVTRAKGSHDIILRHFKDHQANILIGTQMIAKGLDLPLVTLVGVISADVGLNLPDYRAAERVFHTLAQVAGRAGRSLLGGRVILQTYQPDHYVVQAASRHDYAAFYEQETAYRRQYGYPPFGRLVRLVYRHLYADRAETEARRMADVLTGEIKKAEARSTTLIGPAPCFYDRLDGLYRWQIVLRGPNPAALVGAARPKDWLVEVDPLSLL